MAKKSISRQFEKQWRKAICCKRANLLFSSQAVPYHKQERYIFKVLEEEQIVEPESAKIMRAYLHAELNEKD